jgi:hypothetical protein
MEATAPLLVKPRVSARAPPHGGNIPWFLATHSCWPSLLHPPCQASEISPFSSFTPLFQQSLPDPGTVPVLTHQAPSSFLCAAMPSLPAPSLLGVELPHPTPPHSTPAADPSSCNLSSPGTSPRFRGQFQHAKAARLHTETESSLKTGARAPTRPGPYQTCLCPPQTTVHHGRGPRRESWARSPETSFFHLICKPLPASGPEFPCFLTSGHSTH